MMRITSAIVCLAGLWLFCGSIGAQPKDPIKPKAGLPTHATGRGQSEAKAKEDALREAVKTVNALLNRPVDEDYVRDHLLVDEGHAGEDLRIENIDEPFKSWIVTYRYNWWNEAVRHERSTGRESLAASVMFGIAILLVIGVGYVRLDEYTQHRYTTWLRAAGSGMLALILAGTYFFFQGW